METSTLAGILGSLTFLSIIVTAGWAKFFRQVNDRHMAQRIAELCEENRREDARASLYNASLSDSHGN